MNFFVPSDDFENIINNTIDGIDVISSLKSISTGFIKFMGKMENIILDFLEMNFGLEQLLRIVNLLNILRVKLILRLLI